MKKKNIAIVTGANSGIGKEFVKLLTLENSIDEIWAIARNEERLNQLRLEFGNKIKVFSLDLTNRESLNVIKEELNKDDVNIQYLINNAGFAKFCSYDDISLEESLNMIDLNICAVVALVLICVPYMSNCSHILNIASQASFQPLPYMNIYASTKAFVRNYTRALNIELKEKGITATAVCPGWMKTSLFDRGNIGAKKGVTNFAFITTPDLVAEKALKDAKNKKDISIYGIYVKSCHLLAKLLPQKIVMQAWLLQQRNK